MAEITIRFRHNAATGKRELIVHLESDSDVLGHEHERDHRRLVEQLTGLSLDDDTDVHLHVERVVESGTHLEQQQENEAPAAGRVAVARQR